MQARLVRILALALLLGALGAAPAAADEGEFSAWLPLRIEAAQMERQIFDLVQAERRHAGVPPLAWDGRLAEVARAHSADMRDHGFVGHLSQAGDTAARVHRAGIATSVLLENVARAYSPHETHYALMQSPGHRANILNAVVTRVGIGVELNVMEDGDRELYVTQIFLRPPEVYESGRTLKEVLDRVQKQRREAGWLPLQVDEQLSALAQETAAAVSQGREGLGKDHFSEVARRALPRMQRYRALCVVLIRTVEARLIDQVAAVDNPRLTRIGLGGAPDPSTDPLRGANLNLVLVLAEDSFLDGYGGSWEGTGDGYQR